MDTATPKSRFCAPKVAPPKLNARPNSVPPKPPVLPLSSRSDPKASAPPKTASVGPKAVPGPKTSVPPSHSTVPEPKTCVPPKGVSEPQPMAVLGDASVVGRPKRPVCESSSSSQDRENIPLPPQISTGIAADPVPNMNGNVNLDLIPIPKFLLGDALGVPIRHPNPCTSPLTRCYWNANLPIDPINYQFTGQL